MSGRAETFRVSQDAWVESTPTQGSKVKISVVSTSGADRVCGPKAEIEVHKDKILSMVAEVKQLVQPPVLAENLEMAAQLLEDSCGDVMKWLLKGMLELKDGEGDPELLNGDYILAHSSEYPIMAARLLIVKHLPVSGILTTNYDQLLCFCNGDKRAKNPCSVAKGVTPQAKLNKPQYLSMIRNRDDGVQEAEDAACCSQGDAEDRRLVIQIHGSTSDPQSIVLTREGYRSLLHLNPAYSNFLKTVMAGSTLLYMGFSFTDGYFNEIRSELMTLREDKGRQPAAKTQPFSYAVIDNKPQVVRDFFTDHEGVHLFSWQPAMHGFGVMDRYLECLLRCTHLAAALSQCKVLLFNPSTSPLFLVDGQEVKVVGQQQLLDDYLPQGWEEADGFEGRVVKAGVYEQVEDWLLVRLKEPLTGVRDGGGFADPTVFTAALGNVAAGRAFFVPRRFVQTKAARGDIQEDTEVHILVEGLKSFHSYTGESLVHAPRSRRLSSLTDSVKKQRRPQQQNLQELMGMDFNFGHYLAPYGLRVLDTRCYAVELNSGKVRVIPHKLLRLATGAGDGGGEASRQLQQSVSLDLTGIARKVAEETLKYGAGDPALLNDPTV